MLSVAAIRDAVTGGLWTSVTVVQSTGSTNADMLAAGGPEGQVLVAEEQTAGRGRMGRTWVSEPGAALTFSVLLRPFAAPAPAPGTGPGAAHGPGAGLGPHDDWLPLPPERVGWLPLLTGVAVARGIREASGLPATLKWPNDVLIDGRKLCGILAEQSGDAVVIGIGINVATRQDALPAGPGGLRATSLAAEGAEVSRERLLIEILRQFAHHYSSIRINPDSSGGQLVAEYEALCATLGRIVRVELPAGRTLSGLATGVDPDGRLLVTDAGVTTPVSAGDIVHLR